VIRKNGAGQFLVKNPLSDPSSALFPVWYPRTLDRLKSAPL
jgi:hypothetical protein